MTARSELRADWRSHGTHDGTGLGRDESCVEGISTRERPFQPPGGGVSRFLFITPRGMVVSQFLYNTGKLEQKSVSQFLLITILDF